MQEGGLQADKGKGKDKAGTFLLLNWGCIGIMEKKMETTIVYWGYTEVILGLNWGSAIVVYAVLATLLVLKA